MLFKLSLKNIRRSVKDYMIYFFTLIVGVAIFYIFNAVETQAAYLELSEDKEEMLDIFRKIMSAVSVFVAIVLGLLIIYASRFLMKRRNREFAIYLTLGMSKTKVSMILVFENIIIGICSLAAGLAIGIGLSQLMSAFIVDLFDADMTKFRFTLSGDAIAKTLLYFGIMYLVVILFNSNTIGRCKLIDLIQSGKRAEQLRTGKLYICLPMFIVSIGSLTVSYILLSKKLTELSNTKITAALVLLAAGTLLFFWSLSEILMRFVMSLKGFYHKGINSFTFRQISSKIKTMVFSMTVICLMLFITISLLTTAFSARNTLTNGVKKYFPSDVDICYVDKEEPDKTPMDVLRDAGYDPDSVIKEYIIVTNYKSGVKLKELMGDYSEELAGVIAENFMMYSILKYDFEMYSISEINEMLDLRGEKKLSLKDDEYLIMCNMDDYSKVYNKVLSSGREQTVNGKTLRPASDKVTDGFVSSSFNKTNSGCMVVPDDVCRGLDKRYSYFHANYKGSSNKEKRADEKKFLDMYNDAYSWTKDQTVTGLDEPDKYAGLLTKFQLMDETVGIGAIVTFLGLYIGFIFLISSGAVLALKELSESVDSSGKYEMLRKIGAEENAITRSLLIQVGLFFIIPLLLALIHSIFGMRLVIRYLDIFVKNGVGSSSIMVFMIILLIYGGYFLLTFIGSRTIIRKNDQKH